VDALLGDAHQDPLLPRGRGKRRRPYIRRSGGIEGRRRRPYIRRGGGIEGRRRRPYIRHGGGTGGRRRRPCIRRGGRIGGGAAADDGAVGCRGVGGERLTGR